LTDEKAVLRAQRMSASIGRIAWRGSFNRLEAFVILATAKLLQGRQVDVCSRSVTR
jgi:hypothetical protein